MPTGQSDGSLSPGDTDLCHVDKTSEHRSWRLMRINDFIILESRYPISKWLVLHIQLYLHAGKHTGYRQTLCYLHILLKYAHIQMAMKPFPKPSFVDHMGPSYNQEQVPHESQGWCTSPVLKAVNGWLMSEWNIGSCGSNLNLYIKIPKLLSHQFLIHQTKFLMVSLCHTEQRLGTSRATSEFITLIDCSPHTALPSGQFILSASLPGGFLQCFWPVLRLISAAWKRWGLPDGNTTLVPLLCNPKLWFTDQLHKAVTFSLTHLLLACFFSLSCVLHSQFAFLGLVFQRNSLDSSPLFQGLNT